jgi:hypothetical protein
MRSQFCQLSNTVLLSQLLYVPHYISLRLRLAVKLCSLQSLHTIRYSSTTSRFPLSNRMIRFYCFYALYGSDQFRSVSYNLNLCLHRGIGPQIRNMYRRKLSPAAEGRFNAREGAASAHLIRRWVDRRTGLNPLQKTELFAPAENRTSIVRLSRP